MDFDLAREIMVDSQIRPDDVTEPRIVSAFLKTPREEFVPNARRSVAYSEMEIRTSDGRSLWTPRDTAKLIKAAAVKPADIVLVIGAGAGYEAALLSHLADTVIALDESAALTEAMAQRFAALGLDRIAPVEGSLAEGLPEQAPFDVIYVCGMIETVPDAWGEQLAEGGRLVAVVSQAGALGRGKVFTRAGNTLSSRDVFDACPPRFAEFDRKPSFTF
ncbi:protein-L-isoaspartate O-methyltransferase family protein [Hyphomonas sp.]|uniref:protein-L-isoaspartate O-methyltransferase family protein n=1 Tax=Hyphomonas sp. TaxID=87 RepID=UPI00391B5112